MSVFDLSNPIAVGSDHAGFEYKQRMVEYLRERGYTVLDLGAQSTTSADYPDFAHPVASAVEEGKASFGVLICGSANGVAITANKHQGIRAAICWQTDIAKLARQHNDANIICIPARFVAFENARDMTDLFIATEFEGGRHQNRVNKIACL